MSVRYGLDHVLLNLERPCTWLNMGYWKQRSDRKKSRQQLTFVEACENLYRLLLNKAKASQKDRILDFACGCGDQIRFFHELIGEPMEYYSLTYEKQQFDLASMVVDQIESKKYIIRHSDALNPVLWSDLLKRSIKNQFNLILCLDAVYHWNRWEWLEKCLQILSPNGTIAYTDICIADEVPLSWTVWFLCLITGSTFVQLAQYKNQLETFNICTYELEDITPFVFEPLGNYIKDQQLPLWRSLGVSYWKYLKYDLMQRMFRSVKELRFITVHIKKK